MIQKLEIIEPVSKFCSQIKEKFHHCRHKREIFSSLLVIFLWLVGNYFIYFSPPIGFPKETIVRISKGATIEDVAVSLVDKKFIQSKFIFKTLARFSQSGKIIAGDYRFKQPVNVFTLTRRLTNGEYGIEPVRVVILEGLNSREIAEFLAKKLPNFNKEFFISLAEKQEGRLFPDTYFIKPADDETDIVKMMTDNFDHQVISLRLELMSSGKSLNEILTMASLIELETRTEESRRMVSGILWNRLKRDMKLQVDAVFPYIMEKYSLQLTIKDLQFDSPYNTYRYKGLPPGPVGNPGLDSIRAAINPTKTDYLYYLSSKDGTMHYAKNYQAHMINRQKYLSN